MQVRLRAVRSGWAGKWVEGGQGPVGGEFDESSRWIDHPMATTHCLLLSTCCSLLAARCSLLTAHCSLLIAYYSLPAAHCSLLAAHCPLLAAHCPLPTSHCPLPTAHSRLDAHYFLPVSLVVNGGEHHFYVCQLSELELRDQSRSIEMSGRETTWTCTHMDMICTCA